jgi:hypothetical protein
MNKINTTSILEKYKMLPKHKAKMNIPLCKMISMPIVRLALKFDVFKMEQAFYSRYYKGDNVSYVSPLNWKGHEEFVDDHEASWNCHCRSENQRFEDFLLANLDLKSLSKCIFWCGMASTSCKHG